MDSPPGGPTPREALERLEIPVRWTALLLFSAPLVEVALQVEWGVALARALPGALHVPAAAALALALLAVARPSRLATALAVAAAGGGALLAVAAAMGAVAGLPVPVTGAEAFSRLAGTVTHAAVVSVVFGAIGWGVVRHGRGWATPPFPEPRAMGIDFLE